MSLQMLPLLIKSELFSFSCRNQIPKCLENNRAWDGSKVTCSDSFPCQMKFNYIHCFYYLKYIGHPSPRREIPCYFIQDSFYVKRKEVCCGGEENNACPSPTPHKEIGGCWSPADFPSPIISLYTLLLNSTFYLGTRSA